MGVVGGGVGVGEEWWRRVRRGEGGEGGEEEGWESGWEEGGGGEWEDWDGGERMGLAHISLNTWRGRVACCRMTP